MPSAHLVALLVGVLPLCLAQDRRPTISFITQPEIVTDIGGTIEMRCNVQYAQDYPVIWMKLDPVDRNNDLPITTGTTLILTDPRFHITYVPDSSSYRLRIEDIQETDGAIYQCQVLISLTDKEVAEVPLIVRQPPVISDNSTRSVVATEGQRIELKCYASGYPPPEIYWRRQDNAILPTNTSVFKGNVLVFPSVRKEHRGTILRVITIEKKQFDMDLECNIEAYPAPAITWYRDKIQLKNNQHYSLSHFPFDDEYTNTILRVITIEKKQYANYTCRAVNIMGEAEGHVQLFETVIPICPPACDGYNYSSDVRRTAAATTAGVLFGAIVAIAAGIKDRRNAL